MSNISTPTPNHPITTAVLNLIFYLLVSYGVYRYRHWSSSKKTEQDKKREETRFRADAVRRYIEQRRTALGKPPGSAEGFQLHDDIPVYLKVDTQDGLTFSLMEGKTLAAANPTDRITITPSDLLISVMETAAFGLGTSEKVLMDAGTRDNKMVYSVAVDDFGNIHLFLDPQTFEKIPNEAYTRFITQIIKVHSNTDSEAQSAFKPISLDQTARLIVKPPTGESRDVSVLLKDRMPLAKAIERAGLYPIYRRNQKGDEFNPGEFVEPGSMTLLYVPAIKFIYPQREGKSPQQSELVVEQPVTMRDLILFYNMEWLSDPEIELRTANGYLVNMPRGSATGTIIQPGETIIGHWRS